MTEITDDDVERAWNAYRTTPGSFREAIKAAIEAALSPPKPEIEVTEGMIEAAKIANPIWEWGPGLTQRIKEIYRAMREVEAQEPRRETISEILERFRSDKAAYAAKPAPQGVSSGAPVKETGGGVVLVATSDLYGQKVKIGDTVYIGPFGGRKALVVGIQVVTEERSKTKRFP